MQFERVLRELYCSPLLILPSEHQVLCSVVEQRIERGKDFNLEDVFPPRRESSVEDGIAIIPVEGVMARNVSKVEQSCGVCDTGEVAATLASHTANPDVKGIFLDVDSPGGSVQGISELGTQVADARKRKPVFAYTDGLMASAAYWVSAGASAVYASESATVGSVGVYLPVVDQSALFKAKGIEVDVIKAGKFKGAGLPGTSLSEEQRQDLQDGVDYIYKNFVRHIRSSRNTRDRRIQSEVLQGQTFIGSQGKDAGLVDSISSRSKAMNDLRRMATA